MDNPADGSLMNTNVPYVKISYSDTGSGLDLSTLEIKIDGALLDNLNVTESQADGTVR